MYNAHWIHSLPYSKFIELTLSKFKIVVHFIYNLTIFRTFLITRMR